MDEKSRRRQRAEHYLEEEISLTSRVADFFNSTTVHGVGRIYGQVEISTSIFKVTS